jgi:hypothetical protein
MLLMPMLVELTRKPTPRRTRATMTETSSPTNRLPHPMLQWSAHLPEQIAFLDGRSDGRRGRDASRMAAVSVKASAEGLRSRVFGAIRDLGEHGATCDDVEVVLDMMHQTASARVHELAWAGLIRDSGRQRKTRSGRAAIGWVAPSE